MRCDSEAASIMEEGCALNQNQQRFGQIIIQDCPPDLSIRLLRDEIELASVDIPLNYQTSQPNGTNCEPTCIQARGELSLEE